MIAQLNRPYVVMRPWKAVTRLASYGLFEGRALLQPGRFVNPLVFGLYALARRLPRLRAVERPLFFIGTGRSGSTILGLVLSFHRDVGFLNEPKALWHALLPDEDVIGSFGSGPARYRLDERHASPEVIEGAHRIAGFYLAATGARRLLDKTEATFRVPLLRRVFPDARFLLLVRNGWDVCRSIDAWSRAHGMTDGDERVDWWGRNDRKWRLLVDQVAAESPAFAGRLDELRGMTSQLDRAAVEWTLAMREGLAWRERLPEAVTTVRFETLCAEPEAELRRLARECGLREDGRFIDYGKRVLRPLPARAAFEPHPAVARAFRETLRALGYPDGDGAAGPGTTPASSPPV